MGQENAKVGQESGACKVGLENEEKKSKLEHQNFASLYLALVKQVFFREQLKASLIFPSPKC